MFHLRRERLHDGGESLAAIIDLRDVGVGLAGEMDELHFLAVAVPHRQRLEHELVDAVRALAAAHDEDDGQRGIQPEFFRRDRAIDPRQAAAHRRAGDDAMGPAQIIRAALETEQRLVHPRRDHPRDAAGNGVRFVNQRRQMEMASEQQRNRAGEAAHADHGGRLEIAIDLRRTRANCSSRLSPNLKTRGERKPGQPMPGSACDCCSFAPSSAMASICFGETSSSVSCPRWRSSSATANPGKRWPPVPPQAMAIFIGCFQWITFAHCTTSASAPARSAPGKCPAGAC